jgi:hypothetical protein
MKHLYRYMTTMLTISALLSVTLSCAGNLSARKGGYTERERRVEGAAGLMDYEKPGVKRRDKRHYGKKSEADDRISEVKASRRMIVYFARYTIMVENVEQSVRAVEGMAKKFEGFIESSASSDSYRYAKVILRVPVASFDEALKDVERLGRVNSKSVSATDVTMEFNDTRLRLGSAKKVRERMYQLLKRTKKVSERIKILREIERLTTLIESLDARLKYLKNRASFSTIEINFRAVVKQVVSRYIPSPFPWISGLNVNRRSIFSKGKLEYEKPEGFFFQSNDFYDKKANIYLFSSPGEKAEIRAGVVDNYPPADFKFWKEAFAIDVENRKYTVMEKSELSGKEKFMRYAVKINSGVYVVAFAVSEKKIAVVEARFSTEQEYRNQRDKLIGFIKSVRFK